VVVIGGEIAGAWQILHPIIKECLRSQYLVPPMRLNVRPSSVQRPSLFGAIPIALQHCFRENPERRGDHDNLSRVPVGPGRRIQAWSP
jgi:hypothetical protein